MFVPVIGEEGVEGGRKRAAANGEAVANPVVGRFVGFFEWMVGHDPPSFRGPAIVTAAKPLR